LEKVILEMPQQTGEIQDLLAEIKTKANQE